MTKISIMAVVGLLAIGIMPYVGSIIPWPVIIPLISSAIVSGATIAAGTLNLPFRVVVKLEVENWTKFQLTNVEATPVGGYIRQTPPRIRPGQKELMIAHKVGTVATGSYGVTSWRIAGKNRRIVIMWSAPFSFDFHKNYLAVGLTATGYTSYRDSWYSQMYYYSSGNGLRFIRKKYDYDMTEILFDDPDFQIVASMGSSHRPTAKIILRPKNMEDLAPTLRDALQK